MPTQNADLFQLTVAAGTPKPIPTLSLANLQGWLAGSAAAEEEQEDIPTIAVVAYYDAFSAAPVAYRHPCRSIHSTHTVISRVVAVHAWRC